MRQYIGARYVPKLFTNSNGSNDWSPNTSYEPLTIVIYGNSSYTSKTQVPPSVGNPAENPLYWVMTGNNNGFIQEINNKLSEQQEDIVNIKTDLGTINNKINNNTEKITKLQQKSKLSNKSFVLIGDSWGTGLQSDGSHNNLGWGTVVKNQLQNMGAQVYANPQDSASFASSYLSQLNQSTLTSATDVIVIGGANDYNIVFNDLTSYMRTFYQRAQTKYPGCNVYYLNISRTLRSNRDYFTRNSLLRNSAPSTQIIIVPNAFYVAYSAELFGNDNLHLNSMGQNIVNKYVLNFCLTKQIDVMEKISSNEITYIHNEFKQITISSWAAGVIQPNKWTVLSPLNPAILTKNTLQYSIIAELKGTQGSETIDIISPVYFRENVNNNREICIPSNKSGVFQLTDLIPQGNPYITLSSDLF